MMQDAFERLTEKMKLQGQGYLKNNPVKWGFVFFGCFVLFCFLFKVNCILHLKFLKTFL